MIFGTPFMRRFFLFKNCWYAYPYCLCPLNIADLFLFRYERDFMDELEDIHTDQTNIFYTTMKAEGEGLDLKQSFITDRSKAVPL